MKSVSRFSSIISASVLLTAIRPVARQHHLTQPTYKKRAALVANIPSFWPLVFEQSPPDIDQFIQPSDSAVFASCLTSLEVERFEVAPLSSVDSKTFGEPRSLLFRFHFSENEYFSNSVLEKRFWFRRAPDGWAGRVSEPVKIDWKKGKDLTNGMGALALRLFEAQKKGGVDENGKSKLVAKDIPEFQALKKKVESSSEGLMSFFAWFGFRGRWASKEENDAVLAKEKVEREQRKKGERPEQKAEQEEDDDFPTEEIDSEIFPAGEELAVAMAEDLWPGALKYFTQAQEDGDEDLSDLEFESGNDEDMSDEDNEVVDIRALVKGKGKATGNEGPPTKKRRT